MWLGGRSLYIQFRISQSYTVHLNWAQWSAVQCRYNHSVPNCMLFGTKLQWALHLSTGNYDLICSKVFNLTFDSCSCIKVFLKGIYLLSPTTSKANFIFDFLIKTV